MALLLTLNSCEVDPCGNAPTDLIENMEDLVKEVNKKEYKPKDERWKSYDDRFQVYFEDCYDRWRPDMTSHQRRQFAGLVTRYVANRFGKSLFRSVFGKGESDADEIPESMVRLGEEVKLFWKENTETGKEVLEDLIDEISEWFDNEGESK